MILKVREPGPGSWRFFDYITDVSVMPYDMSGVFTGGTYKSDEDMEEMSFCERVENSGREVTGVRLQCKRMERVPKYLVLDTNTTAYLLNDEGKTIERLY